VSEDQKLAPAVETEPAKKASAGEVLSGLRDDIALMAGRLDEVAEFSRRAKDALLGSAEEHRAAGILLGLKSVFFVHDVVFRHLGVEPTDASNPDDSGGEFLPNLLESIEGELGRHRIEVVAPDVGDPHDSALMSILATKPVGAGDTDGTVARVHRCGFVLAAEGQRQVLRKVEVDIHRSAT